MMEIKERCSVREWETFLATRDDARIYHTPGWSRFLQETFRFKPCHLFIKDRSDDLVGLLPLFYVNSPITGKKLSCVPFSHLCGYVGAPFSGGELARYLARMARDKGVDHVEVKGPIDDPGFHRDDSFSLFAIDLTGGVDAIRGRLGKDVKRGIKKSKNAGIKVVRSRGREDVKRYYALNSATKKKLGVPCHSWKFFENLFQCLGENAVLYLGERAGEAVSGLVMVNYGRFSESGYSAHDGRYSSLYPNNCVRWASIEDACARGCTSYDMGRVYRDDAGLAGYKKRWGAAESPLSYSYYPEAQTGLVNRRSGMKYRAAAGVIRHLPLPLYKGVSELVFPYLG